MNPQQFNLKLHRQQQELKAYMYNQFPGSAAIKTLRFIDGNFRAQGWQGQTFQRWKKNTRDGTILVKKGHLRRSFRQEIQPGQVRTYSSSKYAAIHNRGFNGTVNIGAHERRKYTASRIGTGKFNKNGTERMKTIHTESGRVNVKAHTRKMNIPKRQFMPEHWNDSPILVNAIRRDLQNELKRIFN